MEQSTLRVLKSWHKRGARAQLATRHQLTKSLVLGWEKAPIKKFGISGNQLFNRPSLIKALWLRWQLRGRKKRKPSHKMFLTINRWVDVKWNRAQATARHHHRKAPTWDDFMQKRTKNVKNKWSAFVRQHTSDEERRRFAIKPDWQRFVKLRSAGLRSRLSNWLQRKEKITHSTKKYSGSAILLEIIESIKPVLAVRAKSRKKGRIGRQYPYVLPKPKQYLLATRWLKKEVDYYWKSERTFYKRIIAILNDGGSLVKHYLIEKRSAMFEEAVENRQRARWSWLGYKN
jgi:hypothetical protein